MLPEYLYNYNCIMKTFLIIVKQEDLEWKFISTAYYTRYIIRINLFAFLGFYYPYLLVSHQIDNITRQCYGVC